MSTASAKRVAKIRTATGKTAKPDPVKAAKKAAAKPAESKTQKSKTATLKFDHKSPGGKSIFKPANKKGAIITGLYVTAAGLLLLDNGQKTLDLTFKLADSQPNNSYRFNEQGKMIAVGSLYLIRSEAEKIGISDKTAVVKLRIERPNTTSVKVTVSR